MARHHLLCSLQGQTGHKSGWRLPTQPGRRDSKRWNRAQQRPCRPQRPPGTVLTTQRVLYHPPEADIHAAALEISVCRAIVADA